MAHSRNLVPVELIGTASLLPSPDTVPSGSIVPNSVIARETGVTEDHIFDRTGIKSRHHLRQPYTSNDMAIAVGKRLLAANGWAAADIDRFIFGTSSPAMLSPQTWAIQKELGMRDSNVAVMATELACSGLLAGFEQAVMAIETGRAGKALVVGADCGSRVTHNSNRWIFGDGAGGVGLQVADGTGHEVVATRVRTQGKDYNKIFTPLSGYQLQTLCPFEPTPDDPDVYGFHMAGPSVMRWVTRHVAAELVRFCKDTLGDVDCIDWFVPHQANIRIIEPLAQAVGRDISCWAITLPETGNCASGSIPIALDQWSHRFRKGDHVVLVGYGGGLSWAMALIRW